MILFKFQMGVKFENLNIPVILAMSDREYENPPYKDVEFRHIFHISFSAVKSFRVVLSNIEQVKLLCNNWKKTKQKKNTKQMRNVLNFIMHWFVCFESGKFCEMQALCY